MVLNILLGEDDIKELKQGIEVIGTQKLNEMLQWYRTNNL